MNIVKDTLYVLGLIVLGILAFIAMMAFVVAMLMAVCSPIIFIIWMILNHIG